MATDCQDMSCWGDYGPPRLPVDEGQTRLAKTGLVAFSICRKSPSEAITVLKGPSAHAPRHPSGGGQFGPSSSISLERRLGAAWPRSVVGRGFRDSNPAL